jgi:two-component system, cell cycle response regulator DivK
MKILLIEDNELNRDMLKRRLERHGHEIATAVDGQQGVDLATSQPFDAILMDLELPVLDGWQAIDRIKSSSIGRDVPIIVLSGYALAETRDRALSIGCTDFLTKPLDFAQLLEILARHAHAAQFRR